MRLVLAAALTVCLAVLAGCAEVPQATVEQSSRTAELDSYEAQPEVNGGNSGCVASPGEDFTPDSYSPGGPERTSTGKGLRITGTVRTEGDCTPIPYARVEVWHEAAEGGYSNEYRSTIVANKSGEFSYSGPRLRASDEGRPHVHFLARAEGYWAGVVTVEPPAGSPQRIDVLIVLKADAAKDNVPL